jgi:hypothetical protein
MVVSRGERDRLSFFRLITTAVALATAAGCAAPWTKSANEAELPLAQSQAPKVYAKALPPRSSAAAQAKPAPSEADQRMARELERLTKLNDQLTKTIAQTGAAKPQPGQLANTQSSASANTQPRPPAAAQPSAPAGAQPIRKASHEAISGAMQSEFVELAAAEGSPLAATAKDAARFTFSDDGDTHTEQTPAPIVEKTLPPAAEKVESPKPAGPAIVTPEAKLPGYQSGDWIKSRDQTIAQLQEEIAAAKSDKARAGEVAQLETLLRMQFALAGRRDDAVRPVKELRDSEQEFWRSQALGLADLLAADRLANESRRYAVALKSLEEAESHLAAASSLTLRNIALCRKVQDFGVVERFKTSDFKANQEVLLYVEIRNFTAKQKDDHQYETELQGSFRVLDRAGTSRAERTLPLDRQTCANLRRDYYIAYRLYIPTELAPGSYTLELTVEDKKGGKSNNALLDFNVVQ